MSSRVLTALAFVVTMGMIAVPMSCCCIGTWVSWREPDAAAQSEMVAATIAIRLAIGFTIVAIVLGVWVLVVPDETQALGGDRNYDQENGRGTDESVKTE